MKNPLLPTEMISKIPVEFNALLNTGYHVPIEILNKNTTQQENHNSDNKILAPGTSGNGDFSIIRE